MAPPVRILLVEDDPDVSRMFARRLAWSAGATFEIDNVTDLESALLRIENETYDAVLLDLGLPDGEPTNTLAFAGALARHLPIVILTGHEDLELARMAARHGCQDYLVKPQDGATLGRSVLAAIDRQRWIRVNDQSEGGAPLGGV